MKHIFIHIFIVAGLVTLASCGRSTTESDLLGYVDTRVGTDAAVTRTAGLFGKGSEEHGQTLPAVGVPHGMNLWTPQTRDTEEKCIAPYYYADTLLQGFRNSHWIVGGCTQDYGSMTLHAMGGSLRTSPEARATLMDRASEVARPDYYSLRLPDEGLAAEMTGLSRAGIFRFSYESDGRGHIVVNPNSDEGEGYVEVDTLRREIRGCNPVHRIYQGWGEPAGFAGYFVVRLSPDVRISGYGTFCGDSVQPGQNKLSTASGIGAYITFDACAGQPVMAKVGSSFTSIDAAEANLEAEIPSWDFEAVRAESARQWLERLGRVRVEGGTKENMRKFYGALYRASLLPRVVSDADGSYTAFAGGGVRRMPAGGEYYDDFSMWDTYRALHPLLTLLDPERSGRMMQSLVLKAQQGGWMPVFPCWNSYTAAMIGDHCAAAIADAAVKGVDNFDIEEAYKYLRRNAFCEPATYDEYADGMGRRALRSYLEYGYIPLEDSVGEAFHKREQTSRTLEYAFDDFALAQLALRVDRSDDAAELLRRSQNYRNVIDPALGYANGRHADGSFATGTDPFTFDKAITEGAPCHYTWYVPHDVDGLVDALGGRDVFEAKLDSMFGCGRYWHGNEPCHQVAYLYDYIGRPEKTRRQVRHIMDTEYLDAPGGLSGNDDAGQMSAWFVFSAMGFYPVCPSVAEYALGAPLFDRMTIYPGNAEPFVIEAAESDSIATLGGHALGRPFITHADLQSGATLRLPR